MLETDYLIIGSGAVGMAFADTILTETNANIVIVDKLHKPGGHWNFAYPFVTLHQPSAFYGVNSMELSKGLLDQVGLNKGLYDLASGAEVCAYFDNVMQQKFLPSGRVQYFPLCEYQGSSKFKSTLTGDTFEVTVAKKTVDATFMKTVVPATHTPGFKIDPEVQFMPVNNMPNIDKQPNGFVVIGGGKTGIDACLWLLEQQVDPDVITWIVPRDSWLQDRKHSQPEAAFFENFLLNQAAQFEALAEAESIADLYEKLEMKGVLLRIDKTIQPTMYRCATVSQEELVELRRIQKIVRMGRVKRIQKHQVVLEKGSTPTSPDHIHIDCSANGLSYSGAKEVFSGNLITPQTVRTCQPCFSASFIAHVEVTLEDEDKKNELCSVIPLPYHATDWIKMMALRMKNQYNWDKNSDLFKWLQRNRLEGGFAKRMSSISAGDEQHAILERIRNNIKPASMKLQMFMKELA
jgi:thioredoxin reductase